MAQLVKLPDYWVAIESKGFFYSALSILCGGGVKLIRKKEMPNKNLVSKLMA